MQNGLRQYSLILLLFLSGSLAQAAVLEQTKSAIASAHPLATLAGFDILQQGGNAFDAAVAVASTLAVVEPTGSGLGGGGFFLLHRAADGKQLMIDARERAPLKATATMYLDDLGEPVAGASLNGPKAAGIPGLPAALVHLAQRYGRLPLQKSLAPAIRYARNGFLVGPHYRKLAKMRLSALQRYPETKKIFLQNNAVPELGFRLKQPDLARTLRLLAQRGRAGFYQGAVARKMVNAVRRHGGIWGLQDLRQYRVVERQPIIGRFRGYRVVSAPLPSSGGIVLVQMLNMLQHFRLQQMSSTQRVHVLVETMRRAYRDRAHYLGDSGFVRVDTARLLSMKYAKMMLASIERRRATPSASLFAKIGNPRPRGGDTTHFSILDKQGNRVAATLSINYPFGSGFTAKGTGVLLNNEMDDFSIKPGVANVYGLVGSSANRIQAGKRPLSSMTPTFLEGPKGEVVILGTPGGSRIITMVLLATLEATAGRGNAQAWVSLPRFHHQYLPDRITYEENAFSKRQTRRLQKWGHSLKLKKGGYGNMHIVVTDKKQKRVFAASDPRGEGLAVIRP